MTDHLTASDTDIDRAASLLREGKLVAFPTETVYGLGADATNDQAVAQIFAAKGRPHFNPLIAHVADLETAWTIAVFDDQAERLASAFWPGPLTLVLPLRDDAGIAPLVTAGLDTIALRVPDLPLAQDLLRAVGGPVAAPSANPSGKISPTSAEHVIEGLSSKIAAVLDGGSCSVGLESTIVGFEGGPTLLRPGGLPAEAIEACLGAPLRSHTMGAAPTAPGQLSSHYAPGAAVRLNVSKPEDTELWLGFGPDCKEATLNLSPSGDLVEAAANLFGYLRKLDYLATEGQSIAVAPIPAHGLGVAILDRLTRAAAPRP
ncbi:L-threonylcarbamoyladenylate synthase [Actibacterium pelagium]|uniref:Threonylcarbamoyl-AMP synthase n=1 Tax=Actibacterium pelagium TaxID=2029103 RepID=A0A917EKK7_9RHOB|nr:L-threonylcarbamoyladenylate synthase [Actibacterium pelagium]GGE53982.1 threonylcarbamoyl-AMP synthase [Actibacterium pelagium]